VKALIKWGRDLDFINVNGVKVARSSEGWKTKKGPGPFLGFEKVEIIRG
jgi:hypothetical protein